MSEITKLYENAGIAPKRCSECDNNMDCGFGKDCYPPFTAEKQIELIKWLAKKDYYTCDYCEIEPRKDGQEWLSYCHFKSWTSNTFEQTLAGLINKIWQDLTEDEKQQVKGILE